MIVSNQLARIKSSLDIRQMAEGYNSYYQSISAITETTQPSGYAVRVNQL